jgi:protein-disulfide isomerase
MMSGGPMMSGGMMSGGMMSGGSMMSSQPATTGLDRMEIEAIVHQYIVANPEVLLEAQASLENKQKEKQQVAQVTAIRQGHDEIFRSPHDGIVGNPNGNISIVEFFDYNCSFCKHAISDMKMLTAADPNLRFVLKEFPILGPDSQKAHVVAQAFQRLMPQKYSEFHLRLLGGQGRATEASAMKVALDLGADETRLRQEMSDPSIASTFKATYDLANRLQITGTPSYVVGDQVVFGALGADVLAQKIAEARAACATPSC